MIRHQRWLSTFYWGGRYLYFYKGIMDDATDSYPQWTAPTSVKLVRHENYKEVIFMSALLFGTKGRQSTLIAIRLTNTMIRHQRWLFSFYCYPFNQHQLQVLAVK